MVILGAAIWLALAIAVVLFMGINKKDKDE